MNVARRNVQAMNELALVLPDGLLIKLIRCLKAVACQKQIEVEGVVGIRTVIKAIEDIGGRAAVMQHGELRRVEEATRTLEGEADKVTRPRSSVSQRRFLASRAERSVAGGERTRR